MFGSDNPPEVDSAELELTEFSATARTLFAAGGVDDTLTEIVDLAVSTIEGCDFAGIFIVQNSTVTTPVHTNEIVATADALQHASGEGPCLDAVTHGSTFYADDLADDARWPTFGPRATELGMRSLLAIPLIDNGILGALNLYAGYPRAFGVIDRARGLLLASLAALAFSAARNHEVEERRDADFHAALATREMIGQAQGILMERERIIGDQAFDLLRRASQHLNIKLREVAEALIETGERPQTGPR